jgi:hypothetical protein
MDITAIARIMSNGNNRSVLFSQTITIILTPTSTASDFVVEYMEQLVRFTLVMPASAILLWQIQFPIVLWHASEFLCAVLMRERFQIEAFRAHIEI